MNGKQKVFTALLLGALYGTMVMALGSAWEAVKLGGIVAAFALVSVAIALIYDWLE